MMDKNHNLASSNTPRIPSRLLVSFHCFGLLLLGIMSIYTYIFMCEYGSRTISTGMARMKPIYLEGIRGQTNETRYGTNSCTIQTHRARHTFNPPATFNSRAIWRRTTPTSTCIQTHVYIFILISLFLSSDTNVPW